MGIGLLALCTTMIVCIVIVVWNINNYRHGELFIAFLTAFIVAFIIIALGSLSDNMDFEVLSGEVLSKNRTSVPCSHTYECHCRNVPIPRSCSTYNGRTSCSGGGTRRECDICTEHSVDFDYDVETNIGSYTIDRVDRQGMSTPQRWHEIRVGDPVANTHMYVNYVKGSANSLYHKSNTNADELDKLIPTYPNKVYDYYKIDRVVSSGVAVPDLPLWNSDLSQVQKKLGPQKQSNVVIVFVNTADQMFQERLDAAWLGGKKNDVIIVIGTTAYPKMDWVGVISWSDSELMKVELRDEILQTVNADRKTIIGIVQKHISSSFVRKPSADFQYLAVQITPPWWAVCLAFCSSVGALFGVLRLFNRK